MRTRARPRRPPGSPCGSRSSTWRAAPTGPFEDIKLADLFVNQVLPYFDQYALSHRFWSPDSRSLVLPIVGDQDVTRITTSSPTAPTRGVVDGRVRILEPVDGCCPTLERAGASR